MAKWARGTYQCDGRGTSWLRIKNPEYTQIQGRHDCSTRGVVHGALAGRTHGLRDRSCEALADMGHHRAHKRDSKHDQPEHD